ncbi:hypothetical protein DAEQUDRAFT_714002 [Daedalea quercina L-15889]|uniref:Uncharacterized protein n=1 Tax=Daedalea quercina L-15889 TaxID=1314783 RepID=A0A165NKZ8_9APHY|nr:hypothetical protein DAEQUDRAFT_714002 [Daedalea quercina L-15889]
MASLFIHLQRGCRPSLAHAFARRSCVSRAIHQTPVALKKKNAHVPESGDLFGDFAEGESSEELFSSEKDAMEEAAATPSVPADTAARGGKLDPEERLNRFNELLQFVALRIGPSPKEKLPQVRNAAWQHLFQLATTREQMEAVVQLFPKWRNTKGNRVFSAQNAELFARRCEELKCPDLALRVFADHPKYGFDLVSLRAARRLLHSLYKEYPLQDTITVAALFGVYRLPPISSDLICCAMFAAACFKHHTTQSLTVARQILPQLKELLTKTDPKEMELPKDGRGWVKIEAKEKEWLARSLANVEEALGKEEGEYSWLSRWRQDSGHAQAVPV